MPVNPLSLANLEKGRKARFKDAKRVTVSLKPSTHERLKNLPKNVSESIDIIVEWVAAAGKVGEIFLGESQNTYNRIQELENENEALKARLDDCGHCEATLRQRLLELEREQTKLRSQLSSQTAPQVSESVELPNAADLLSQLKDKRKKSKADLQDVEAILELLPEQSPPKLPDLYAARDAIMDKWRLLKRNEKRERFWGFANELIEEAGKLDPNYSLLARLQSDLKQEREYSKGIAKGMTDEFRKRIDLEKKMGLRR